MRRSLMFASTLVALTVAGCAAVNAEAVTVMGEGAERACFQAAKTGLDSIAGVAQCNMALNTALVFSDRVATYVNRGVVLHKLGRVSSAMEDYDTALRLKPDYEQAMADIQKSIDLGPSEPALAYYDRAIVYERTGRIREAYYDYQRAVKEAPGFTAAVNALSRFRVTPRT